MKTPLLALTLGGSEANADDQALPSASSPSADVGQFCNVPTDVDPEKLQRIASAFSTLLSEAKKNRETPRTPVDSYRRANDLACLFVSQAATAIEAVRDNLRAVERTPEIIHGKEGYQDFLADLAAVQEMSLRMSLKPGPQVKDPFSGLEDNLLRVHYPGRPRFDVDLSSEPKGATVTTALAVLTNNGITCGPAFEEYLKHYGKIPDLSTARGAMIWNSFKMKDPGNPELEAVDFLAEKPFAFESDSTATAASTPFACGAYRDKYSDVRDGPYNYLDGYSPREAGQRICTYLVDKTRGYLGGLILKLREFTKWWWELETDQEVQEKIKACSHMGPD